MIGDEGDSTANAKYAPAKKLINKKQSQALNVADIGLVPIHAKYMNSDKNR